VKRTDYAKQNTPQTFHPLIHTKWKRCKGRKGTAEEEK
jgi:hypothetical protein